jgi:hypothetical protein
LLHSKVNILQNALTRWSTLKKILKVQSALGEKAVIASFLSGAYFYCIISLLGSFS